MSNIYITDGEGSFARAHIAFSFNHNPKLTFKPLAQAPKLSRDDAVLDLSRTYQAGFTVYDGVLNSKIAFPTFAQDDNKHVILRTIRYTRAQIIKAASEVLKTPAPKVVAIDPRLDLVYAQAKATATKPHPDPQPQTNVTEPNPDVFVPRMLMIVTEPGKPSRMVMSQPGSKQFVSKPDTPTAG